MAVIRHNTLERHGRAPLCTVSAYRVDAFDHLHRAAEKDNECVICMENEPNTVLSCTHAFCQECLDAWFVLAVSCWAKNDGVYRETAWPHIHTRTTTEWHLIQELADGGAQAAEEQHMPHVSRCHRPSGELGAHGRGQCACMKHHHHALSARVHKIVHSLRLCLQC